MECIFISYTLNNSAYSFLVYKSEILDHVKMIIESRDNVFFEDIFPYKRKENKTSEKKIHGIMFRDERSSEPTVMRKLN